MAKVVVYHNERYRGSLSEDVCEVLDQLIELDKANGVVPDLSHVIYSLSNSDVEQICTEGDVYGAYDTSAFEKPLGTLRDEQTIGVAFMYYACDLILGDSVGMGKTVESAGIINLLKAENPNFTYLVLTEKNLASQFRTELVKFTGEYCELISSGEKDELEKFYNRHPSDEVITGGVVGTHALLTTPSFISWLEQCRQSNKFPFDMLIVDESSLMGSDKHKAVDTFKLFRKYIKRSIFLNATPFEAKLNIFYNQLNILDNKFLPTKENFRKEYMVMDYRGMYPRPTGRYKNADKFKQLIAYRYFARTRRDKGATMTNCKGGVVLSKLSDAQKKLLARTQLNRMVYDCPTYLDPSIEFTPENVPKLGSLIKLLKEECKEADSVLVFVYFREAQTYLHEYLTKMGYSCEILNGSTTSAKRDEIIKGFQTKEFKVLITNVQKGLNFGDCDYCMFYSYEPNPSKMVQFEGRTTRSFDIENKNVYILCSLGKEYKTFNSVLKLRAKGMADSTNTDLSVVLSILLGEE